MDTSLGEENPLYEEISNFGYQNVLSHNGIQELDAGFNDMPIHDVVNSPNVDAFEQQLPGLDDYEHHTNVHHAYEPVDENVKIFDVSRTCHFYEQVIEPEFLEPVVISDDPCPQEVETLDHTLLSQVVNSFFAEDSDEVINEQSQSESVLSSRMTRQCRSEVHESTSPVLHVTQPFSLAYERDQLYEKVPNLDVSAFLLSNVLPIYEVAQVYEKVPSVDVAQLLSVAESVYEYAQVYEKVPNVDLTLLLVNSKDIYEIAQTYEKVPHVDISKLLKAVYDRTYEKVPNVDIFQLLSQVPMASTPEQLKSD